MPDQAVAPPPFRNTGPTGHRARMRGRLLAHGAGALADYEVLEMLLFLGIPRRDTKPLAKDLINRFGSLQAVLSAEPERLLAARCGLPPDALPVLALPSEARVRLTRAEPRDRPVLNNWDRLLEYLDVAQAGAVEGQLRGLMLDNRNRLLADEVLDAAEPDTLSRLVAARALTLYATAIILVRILPPGPIDKATPRREAALSAAVKRSAALLSITLHDHLLVGGGNWLSLRQKSLI
ncbi:MAG: DNA repair protein RadC [Gluconacetobacter diazotrophicus]|nr:DNA repair protein RadC [Gluconacetobacter diazotrophicus]